MITLPTKLPQSSATDPALKSTESAGPTPKSTASASPMIPSPQYSDNMVSKYLVAPTTPCEPKKAAPRARLLTSSDAMAILEEKERKKQQEAEEKEQRKKERELKKVQKQEEQKRKAEERNRKAGEPKKQRKRPRRKPGRRKRRRRKLRRKPGRRNRRLGQKNTPDNQREKQNKVTTQKRNLCVHLKSECALETALKMRRTLIPAHVVCVSRHTRTTSSQGLGGTG